MADFGTLLNPDNTTLNLYCNSIKTNTPAPPSNPNTLLNDSGIIQASGVVFVSDGTTIGGTQPTENLSITDQTSSINILNNASLVFQNTLTSQIYAINIDDSGYLNINKSVKQQQINCNSVVNIDGALTLQGGNALKFINTSPNIIQVYPQNDNLYFSGASDSYNFDVNLNAPNLLTNPLAINFNAGNQSIGNLNYIQLNDQNSQAVNQYTIQGDTNVMSFSGAAEYHFSSDIGTGGSVFGSSLSVNGVSALNSSTYINNNSGLYFNNVLTTNNAVINSDGTLGDNLLINTANTGSLIVNNTVVSNGLTVNGNSALKGDVNITGTALINGSNVLVNPILEDLNCNKHGVNNAYNISLHGNFNNVDNQFNILENPSNVLSFNGATVGYTFDNNINTSGTVNSASLTVEAGIIINGNALLQLFNAFNNNPCNLSVGSTDNLNIACSGSGVVLVNNNQVQVCNNGVVRPFSPVVGQMFWDSNLAIPIWWSNLGGWVNALGALV